MPEIDPVELTARLIRCPSVTPADGGALDLLEGLLISLGFACTRIPKGGIDNLYARWGHSAPVFGFAGHIDVVPVGDEAAWTHGPFSGHIEDGVIWGRGATDMKSGVAAFVAAAVRIITATPIDGSIALIITGDEEGEALDGTAAILDWMQANGERTDVCLVGEPTSVELLGDVLKIGRRGSATGFLAVRGKQGHSAYPERAVNPLPTLSRVCTALAEAELDYGTDHFQPSTLALTSIDVGNHANNVIPAEGRVVFNIRFNDQHTGASLRKWAEALIANICEGSGTDFTLEWKVAGESFLTAPGAFTDLVSDAIADGGNVRPQMTTGGGTSDARFIKNMCPVLEFGLVGDTMHQIDERTKINGIEKLTDVYERIMRGYFKNV